MTANQISYAKLREDSRHNTVTEALQGELQRESMRNNQALESIRREANRIDEAYKRGQLALGQSQLAESIRHAKVSERQSLLFGIKSADEQRRSNQRQEELTRLRNAQQERLGMAQVRETNRANLAQESVRMRQQQEDVRHNLISEGLSARQQDMQQRIASQQMLNSRQIAQMGNQTSIATATIGSFSRLAQSILGGFMYAKR